MLALQPARIRIMYPEMLGIEALNHGREKRQLIVGRRKGSLQDRRLATGLGEAGDRGRRSGGRFRRRRARRFFAHF